MNCLEQVARKLLFALKRKEEDEEDTLKRNMANSIETGALMLAAVKELKAQGEVNRDALQLLMSKVEKLELERAHESATRSQKHRASSSIPLLAAVAPLSARRQASSAAQEATPGRLPAAAPLPPLPTAAPLPPPMNAPASTNI